jgi:hypothetical protein
MKNIADFAGLSVDSINQTTQHLTKFAKNFDNLYPALRNLKIVYGEELKKLRLQ